MQRAVGQGRPPSARLKSKAGGAQHSQLHMYAKLSSEPNMLKHLGFQGCPSHSRLIVPSVTRGQQLTNSCPTSPTRVPRQLYTLTEIRGSEEHDLLASSPASFPQPSPTNSSPSSSPPSPFSALAYLPDSLRELFLPPGFPSSVTPDYLPYQVWSLPTHVTGHLSHSLVTSSLLAAVGVSSSPAATVALSASIKWIVKDGVGALGRLIIGRCDRSVQASLDSGLFTARSKWERVRDGLNIPRTKAGNSQVLP